jgi:DNA primase
MTTRKADLAEVLEGLGVDVHKTHGDEINARCPVHYKVKGRESGGYTWYMNSETGLWHCFTCGARGNLSMIVSELTDDLGALWNVQSYLITQGLRRLTAEEAVYDDHDPEVDWVTYSKFATLPQSIIEFRQFDPDVANRFGVKWDTDKKATVVPIVSPLGELRGWQAKKTGWVRNLPEGVNKATTLFGIERAFSETVVLVESPLDVVRFHSVYEGIDINCVSSFGANVSYEQLQLTQRFSRLVIAMDNDKAGRKETERLIPVLPSYRKGVRYWHYAPDDPKDIGEMTDWQIIKGLTGVSSVYHH